MKKVSSVSAVRKLDTKKINTTWKLVRHLSAGFAYLIGMALVQEHNVKIKETENGAEKMTYSDLPSWRSQSKSSLIPTNTTL